MGKLSARKKRVKQRVKIGKVAPETVAHVESWMLGLRRFSC